jgi:glutaredoxin
VSRDFGAAREMVEKYQSRATPTIVVGEEIMVGFDPERLQKLIAE